MFSSSSNALGFGEVDVQPADTVVCISEGVRLFCLLGLLMRADPKWDPCMNLHPSLICSDMVGRLAVLNVDDASDWFDD